MITTDDNVEKIMRALRDSYRGLSVFWVDGELIMHTRGGELARQLIDSRRDGWVGNYCNGVKRETIRGDFAARYTEHLRNGFRSAA